MTSEIRTNSIKSRTGLSTVSYADTGIIVSGIVTATSFSGDGSNLTGITGTTINNNAANRVITGEGGTTLNGEANLTFTGSILTVTNSSGASEITLVTPNNTDSGIYFNDGSNSGALSYQHSDNSMRFRVNATEKLRITSDGKIGQYTSSPSYDFHSYKSSGTTRARLQTNGTSGSDYADIVVQAGGGNYIQSFIYGTGYGYMTGAASQSMTYGNIANAPVYFSTNNTSRALFDTSGNLNILDGNLIVASGHGIDFSATSDTSGSTSELFDDYEEGSWTPSIKGTTGAGTASYGTRSGKYTKVGNLVHLTMEINWSSGSAGGELRVTDLPFSPASDYEGIGACMLHSVYLHGNEGLCIYVGPGINYTYFYQSRSNNSWHSVNYDGAGIVIANVSYRTT